MIVVPGWCEGDKIETRLCAEHQTRNLEIPGSLRAPE